MEHTLRAAVVMTVWFAPLAMPVAKADDREEAAAPAVQGRRDLAIHVRGFAHQRGRAVANLFREGEDVLRKPNARVTAKIEAGTARLVFPALPYGTYAVSVFHDENDNGELDHNLIRLPAEPLGFSNGFKLSLVSGMPSFQKLRFAFDPGTEDLDITVR